MNTVMRTLTLVTALSSIVTGGVMFGFSSMVMPALRGLPAHEAIGAMNAMNAVAPRSVFMLPLLGSTLGGVVVGVYAVIAGPQPGRAWLIAGATGAVATMIITSVHHVPRNNALASAADADTLWPTWAAGWTAYNHLRTVTAVLAGSALAWGARLGR